jgi:hypothetical protein
MARKAVCKVCNREINTQKQSHYKFGKDIVCYVEGTEDCVITYVGWHLIEKGDGSGRYNGGYEMIGMYGND